MRLIKRTALDLLLLTGIGSYTSAQQYVITTIAGGAPPQTPGGATATSLEAPYGIAVDGQGNIYFTASNCVFRLDQSGTLTRIAGNARSGYSGDGGPAINAQLGLYSLQTRGGLALDKSGNVYIADYTNHRVRRVSASGIITTVAGDGAFGYSGDGGPAVSAHLYLPTGVAVDGAGNLYIADSLNQRIRKVLPGGIITTVAGNGTEGYSGDGGPATSAALSRPEGIAIDNSGNLYVAEEGNNRVRKVSNGVITTVAGNGTRGYSGDSGTAINAELDEPFGVAIDSSGNLYIADTFNQRIRKVSPSGIITTVAGNATCIQAGQFPACGSGFSGDSGPAIQAQLNQPFGVAVDDVGTLYVADTTNLRVRRISSSGIINTVAGNGIRGFSGDSGPAARAQFSNPEGVAIDSAGNLYVSDSANSRVRRISPDGIVVTVAGNGTRGYSGDGGPATNAQISIPGGLAVDLAGNLYIADGASVRKVSPIGIITTVAGTGPFIVGVNPGDGGPATLAQFLAQGVAVDGEGNLYIADSVGHRVRKVSPSGIITTVAGTGTSGYSGDGGPATSAKLNNPWSVAIDANSNLYIADNNNARVRRVDKNGIITTVVGNGFAGEPADGQLAASAPLPSSPLGVAIDGTGNLYVADAGVRKVLPNGTITTIAGKGAGGFGSGYTGDGGPASTARLNYPWALTVDSAQRVYVADTFNNAVRALQPTSQSVLVGAVLDGASESAKPVSPGKIVVIYGAGLGPENLALNKPADGSFGTQLAGTSVLFDGTPAPLIYTSATQVSAITPYEVLGPTTQVTVSYQGQTSTGFPVPVAAAAPSIFSLNQSGAGQAAALNLDGTVNTAINPVRIGGYVSLYASGEGQTSPVGIDGKIASSPPYAVPVLPVSVTVGGLSAKFNYAGAAPTAVAGLMQVNVQIPDGVQPGGYVSVVLQVGNAVSSPGIWIAVSGN